MQSTPTANHTSARIHPLVAIAAGSVILVSLAGTAALTGLLPNSKAKAPDAAALQSSAAPAAAGAAAAPVAMAAAPVVQQYALVPVQASAPVALAAAAPVAAPVAAPAPVARKVVYRSRPVQHHDTQVARYDERPRSYERSYSQPAPQAQPVNYLGVGAGALIGGLVGNQVGGGNGKKLATVAGVIGGGMLGNEIANRTQYGR